MLEERPCMRRRSAPVNPFFLMAVLFSVLAALMATNLALMNAGMVEAFGGIRWLRVHLVTLGVATELLFGALPLARAWASGTAAPRTDLRAWALLNGGIALLLIGIPIANRAFVYSGGAMILVAAWLVLAQLFSTADDATPRSGARAPTGKWFYIAGLAYFLVGITVGTGLLFSWATPLRITVPIEVHIHANSWGLMSLAFAGLIVDLLPRWSGRPLAWPGAVRPTFWLMTLGAGGLVLGPWLGAHLLTAPGLVMHVAATLWLLANVVQTVRGTTLTRDPGIWHLTSGYVWIVAPLFGAPFIILEVPWFPGAAVEGNAPQALVYGWMLQVAIAVLPYAVGRALHPPGPARLGGSWLSLAAIHAGSALLWAGIFAGALRPTLHAVAYSLWALALVAPTADAWRLLTAGGVPSSDAGAAEDRTRGAA